MSDLIETGQLYLVADEHGFARFYVIGIDRRPVRLSADPPRHGRGSLGHGYTDACADDAEQCNNSQCRCNLSHILCTPTCSGETYWDDIGPWQIDDERRAAFAEALRGAR